MTVTLVLSTITAIAQAIIEILRWRQTEDGKKEYAEIRANWAGITDWFRKLFLNQLFTAVVLMLLALPVCAQEYQSGGITGSGGDITVLGASNSTTSVSTTTVNNVVATVTIPAGTLAVGETIFCTANYTDNDAATQDRYSFGVGSTNMTTWSASANTNVAEKYSIVAYVTAIGAAGNIRVVRRELVGTTSVPSYAFLAGSVVTDVAIDTTAPINLTFQAWWNSAPTGTISVQGYACYKVVKK